MAGFECSTHRRADGRRLDVIAATQHDRRAASDYRLLSGHGLRTIRDGVRWHLVEPRRGSFDWSSFEPMRKATAEAGVQIIWDLLHFGWPDWTHPLDPDFAGHFAEFAKAAARRIGPGGFYLPINEISFLSWAGGEVAYLNPFVEGQGNRLKRALCKAAIAAIRAIRQADPDASVLTAEPLIHVAPASDSPGDIAAAEALNRAQFDALDWLLGRGCPELGGHPGMVDCVGFNYYPHNQWRADADRTSLLDDERRPLADLLTQACERYGKPAIIAETGCEGDGRPTWLAMVAGEMRAAISRGADLRGICLYPILNHPGWDNDRYCPNGLFCGLTEERRPVYAPLAEELARQQALGIGAVQSSTGGGNQLVSTDL